MNEMKSASLARGRAPLGKKRPAHLMRAVAVAAVALIAAAACASPEEKVENYTQSGESFFDQGDLGKANIQFQNALKIDEEYVPALEGLAKIAENKQDYRRLAGLLQRILRLDPENVSAHVQLGRLMLIASDESAALEHAEAALALEPENLDALSLKAAIQLAVGDTAGAVALARQILEVDPAKPEAVTVLVTERAKEGDYEAALGELDAAIELDPNVAIMQLLRIGILKHLDRDDDVIDAYERMTQLFPDVPAYRRAFSSELLRRGDYDRATEQMEQLIELEPNNFDAKIDLVRIIKRSKGSDAAQKKLQEFASAEPDNYDLQFALSDFLRSEGDVKGADAILSALAAIDDMDVMLRAKNKIASQYLRKGDTEAAARLIDEILQVDNANTEALLKRAAQRIESEKYDQAILDLRTALNNRPDAVEGMSLMALAFERQGNFSFARAEYAKAFDASGKSAKMAQLFARFLVRQKDLNRAEEVLLDSLEVKPGNIESLKMLAGIRLSKQDWRGAEKVAQQIDQLQQEDELADNIMSAVHVGLGEFDKLIDNLEKRNADEPLSNRPLTALVNAYVRTGRFEKAEEVLNDILASNEGAYAPKILLGNVYLEKGEAEKAETLLLEVASESPDRAEAYELLYRHYLRDGERDKARRLVADGLAASPDNDALLVFKADLMLMDGDYDAAFDVYSTLIERRPDNKVIANNFVSLSSELRQDVESVARALEIAKLLEGEVNPNIQDTVGWAYYRAGEFEKAVEFLAEASEGAPDNAEIAYHLGMAHFAAGDMEQSKAALEKARSLGGDAFRFASEIDNVLGRIANE